MCEGKKELAAPRRPPSSPPLPGRRRAAVSESELDAARVRLAESLAALARERARAAALRRRLAESYAERDRLKQVATAIGAVRIRLREYRSESN